MDVYTLLTPFILVYKIVAFFFKIPLNIIKYMFIGVNFISSGIFEFMYQFGINFVRGITLVFKGIFGGFIYIFQNIGKIVVAIINYFNIGIETFFTKLADGIIFIAVGIGKGFKAIFKKKNKVEGSKIEVLQTKVNDFDEEETLVEETVLEPIIKEPGLIQNTIAGFISFLGYIYKGAKYTLIDGVFNPLTKFSMYTVGGFVFIIKLIGESIATIFIYAFVGILAISETTLKVPYDLFNYVALGFETIVQGTINTIANSKVKSAKAHADKIRKAELEKIEAAEAVEDGPGLGYSVMKAEDIKKTSLMATIALLPTTIKEFFVGKYNNLSFVKHYKNRQEMEQQEMLIDFHAESEDRSEKKKVYKYVAKNSEGKVERSTFPAFSKVDVHSYLLSEGYEVYSITEDRFQTMFGGAESGARRIPNKLLKFWLAQLSTYIKAGMPLVDSVKMLSMQAKKRAHKDIFKAIVYELTMGENLSNAMDKQGNAFPKLLINMIKTSEMTGDLSSALDDMADYYTTIEKTRKDLVSAMTYPTVILVFATGVIIFIILAVIPQFVTMFEDLDATLPALTLFIIAASDFLQESGILLFAAVIIFIVIFKLLFDNVKVFKTFIQWMMMKVPIFGKIIIYNEVTMFSKTFSSLLSHSVFITDSMEILSKVTNNEIYKMLIFDTISNLAKGDKISTAFKDHWAFPDVAYQMLVTGEKTGRPAEMMNKVAEHYQGEQAQLVKQMKTLIEPIMISGLTVVAGGILMAVMLPMFSLYSEIG